MLHVSTILRISLFLESFACPKVELVTTASAVIVIATSDHVGWLECSYKYLLFECCVFYRLRGRESLMKMLQWSERRADLELPKQSSTSATSTDTFFITVNDVIFENSASNDIDTDHFLTRDYLILAIGRGRNYRMLSSLYKADFSSLFPGTTWWLGSGSVDEYGRVCSNPEEYLVLLKWGFPLRSTWGLLAGKRILSAPIFSSTVQLGEKGTRSGKSRSQNTELKWSGSFEESWVMGAQVQSGVPSIIKELEKPQTDEEGFTTFEGSIKSKTQPGAWLRGLSVSAVGVRQRELLEAACFCLMSAAW